MLKVEYVENMGDDLSVVNAARVSFDKVSEWECKCGDLWWCGSNNYDWGCLSCGRDYRSLSETDTNLIKYLAKHNHWTPFSHTAITLRMSAPVPIRTQCFKHKAGFTENEESRRYIDSRPEVFVPDEFRMAADNVKQGSGGVHPKSKDWLSAYRYQTEMAVEQYEAMIADNVCPEQARFILPQGCMVNWIWTGNLASYARFYNQRTDPHSQKETQTLAELVGDVVGELYPVSWRALTS